MTASDFPRKLSTRAEVQEFLRKPGCVEEWNSARAQGWKPPETSTPSLDLDDCSHLKDINLSGLNLSGASFVGSVLDGANLSESNLSGTFWSQLSLWSRGRQSSLASPTEIFALGRMTSRDPKPASLQGADLSGSDLTGADLREVNLVNAKLGRSILAAAQLERANLSETDLTASKAIGKARLEGANLTNADLTEADFESADLYWTDMSQVRNIHLAKLNQAKLSGVLEFKTGGAKLQRATLRRATVQGNLSGADLVLATLHRVNLENVDMSEAKLEGAIFYMVNLSGVTAKGHEFKDVRARHPSFFLGLARLDWQTVRAVGSLQALTKVSYLMLLLVPFLASLWPTIRTGLNNYNAASIHVSDSLDKGTNKAQGLSVEAAKGLNEACDWIEKAIKWIEAHVGKLPPDSPLSGLRSRLEAAKVELQHFDAEIQTIRQAVAAHKGQAIRSPNLPTSWALAFFAALAVAFGHLAYQIWAPPTVKEADQESFVDKRIRDLSSGDRARIIAVGSAIHSMQELARALPRTRFASLVIQGNQVIFVPDRFDAYLLPQGDLGNQSTKAETGLPAISSVPPDVNEGNERLRILLESGSRAEYELQAIRNWPMACISFSLYVLGGILVGWIVTLQTISVLDAAGWIAR